MKKSIDLIKVAQWIVATAMISVSTCYGVIKFAYSDFETQRSSDIYRKSVDERLNDINVQLVELNRKVDKILLRK
jgi:hypothetical protein